jgi:hypothetical protein
MNNSMVAHLWAHEQEESASGSNFFFEGTSIYSYGHHFEVGRIVKNKQGKKAYLINEKYSTKNLPKAHFRWDWGRYTLSKESVDKITEFVDAILKS